MVIKGEFLLETISVGELIIRLRRTKQISQEELAHLCLVSRKYLSNIETNKTLPNKMTILALAKVFKVYPSDFTNVMGEMLNKKYDEWDENEKLGL
jgi:transcriptional regulator with XRE-family HTH domain